MNMNGSASLMSILKFLMLRRKLLVLTNLIKARDLVTFTGVYHARGGEDRLRTHVPFLVITNIHIACDDTLSDETGGC